jgi:uncharacterized membrane protein SirB2
MTTVVSLLIITMFDVTRGQGPLLLTYTMYVVVYLVLTVFPYDYSS